MNGNGKKDSIFTGSDQEVCLLKGSFSLVTTTLVLGLGWNLWVTVNNIIQGTFRPSLYEKGPDYDLALYK